MNYKKFLNLFEITVNKIFNHFEKHFTLFLITLFILGFAIRLFFTPFDLVLRYDAFYYLLKSLEITKGNLTPSLTNPLGWSLFMSPFFYFFGNNSIFQNMTYTRIISDFIGALSIFPLTYIGKKLLDKRSLIFLLILFVFSSELVISSTLAYTEPLFMFFLLMSLYFIIKAKEKQNYILIASIFGAFSYYVRFNGIFILFIILSSFFLLRREIPKFNYSYMIYVIAIFFLVSAPFLYQRYKHFGSPFFYGANSKYFVDSYTQVWDDNIPVPSLIDYLKSHTVKDYFRKFVTHGVYGVISDYTSFIITPLIFLFFFLYGFLKFFKNKKFIPLSVTLLVWLISLTPVWHIFGTSRHLVPTIPFILIFTTASIDEICTVQKYRNILLFLFFTLFLILFTPFSLKVSRQYWYNSLKSNVHDGVKWARWVTQNIKGKIALKDGGDLIQMYLLNINKNNGIEITYKSDLEITGFGSFKDFSSAMRWFKENGITHLAISESELKERPYFKEIYSEEEPPKYLKEVYSNYNTDSKWKIRIYSLDWTEYEM